MPITSKFVCLNGRFLKEEELSFNANNRAFRYGDGFFETMHYANGEIQLFDLHQARMKKAINLLKLDSNILLNINLIHKEIVHLINANHFFKGARVRLSIYRDGAGLYSPETNKANYLIENWALESKDYPLNKKGLSMGIYSQIKKPQDPLSFYKSLNTRVSVLASLHKKELGTDDCFLCNTDSDIIESISSNTFFIKGDTVYTSSINSGCIHGIMRHTILTLIENLGFKLIDNAKIKEEQLKQFDEIFISNSIQGIQWVGAYRNKRYDNKITKQIHKQLLSVIFNR